MESGFVSLYDEDFLLDHTDLSNDFFLECESCDNVPGCDCDNPCYNVDCD